MCVAIVAGALANWVMLVVAFSIWFDIDKIRGDPRIDAAIWLRAAP